MKHCTHIGTYLNNVILSNKAFMMENEMRDRPKKKMIWERNNIVTYSLVNYIINLQEMSLLYCRGIVPESI